MNRARLIRIMLLAVTLACSLQALARGGGHGGGGRGGSWGHAGGFHHGRGGVGFFVGSPFWGYPFWPYYGSYYPYAYPVPVPTQPPTYIEQDYGGEGLPANYWYYCSNPPGYYPSVTDCPVGWQQVPPQ